jgi:hypothetical protein
MTGGSPASGDLAVISQLQHLFGQLDNASQTLSGTIFPAGEGEVATIEVRAGERWRRSAVVRLGTGGSYAVTVVSAGTYRVVYHGLDGPPVVVH